MASSIQAAIGLTFIAPANQPFSRRSCHASASSLPSPVKSQFFGSTRIQFVSSRVSSKHGSQVRSRSNAIVSASFLDKLVKLFSKSAEDEEQVMALFEFNEGDRQSPFVVKNNKTVAELAVGDFVPYTNKVYDCTAKRYLGISAGMCTVVEHHDGSGGARYETTMSHYLGDYGHICCQGPYMTYSDSEMVVTGGTGIFKGARGIVKCHNIVAPLKLLYTYHIKGIPMLPSELTQGPVILEEQKQALNSNNTEKVTV